MAANPQTTTLHKTNQTLTSTEPVGAPEAVAALGTGLSLIHI